MRRRGSQAPEGSQAEQPRVSEDGAGGDAPSRERGSGMLRRVLVVLLFLFGAAVMLYPAFCNLYNQYMNACIANDYAQTVDEADPKAVAAAWRAARAYNAKHTVNVVADPFAEAFAEAADEALEGSSSGSGSGGEDAEPDVDVPVDKEYEALLNIAGDGVMGYVDIPKIGQRLAIYHGTSPEVLEKGVGHLYGTSLPVGGKGSHCVLSGHRGLPQAALFTDLDQIEPGDQFYLHVLDKHLAYEVDGTKVVKPERVEPLAIKPGRDLCTLVTCTPYAVNTHRMLVMGHRVPYVAPEDPLQTPASWLASLSPVTLAVAGVLSAIVLVGLVVLVRRMRRRGDG